ncbi:MAG: hypothetical protein JW951_05685 [Lentisphaerae bacterium]|nr:hypothetical protein [Lentisphaerota bacterium]
MRRLTILLVLASVMGPFAALGQNLRYDNHREVAVPDYAKIRIGPFYSSARFSLSAGYRYVDTSGTGTDFLFGAERGEFKEDGSDLPVIAQMTFRNYLLLSRRADLDVSFSIGYEYYPLDTQEDGFFFYPPAEGFFGNLSSSLQLSPTVNATVYDRISYRTDYVDARGEEDRYGGREYERFENIIGTDIDWLMDKYQNLGLSFSREDVIPRDDDPGEFNRQERTSYNEGLIYERRVTRRAVAGARADLQQNLYPDDDRSDTYLYAYSAFFHTELTPRTKASASLGYGYTTFESPAEGQDDREGTIIGGAGIESALNRETTHSLSYYRQQVRGFDSDIETVDQLRYRLQWAGRFSAASLTSVYAQSDPVYGFNDYTDWTTRLHYEYPLISFITLLFDAYYQVRDNDELNDAEPILQEGEDGVLYLPDLEEREDYTTWSAQVGTSFGIMENVDFRTYAQHIERDSDAEDLAYERNILSAMFTYSHEF